MSDLNVRREAAIDALRGAGHEVTEDGGGCITVIDEDGVPTSYDLATELSSRMVHTLARKFKLQPRDFYQADRELDRRNN